MPAGGEAESRASLLPTPAGAGPGAQLQTQALLTLLLQRDQPGGGGEWAPTPAGTAFQTASPGLPARPPAFSGSADAAAASGVKIEIVQTIIVSSPGF